MPLQSYFPADPPLCQTGSLQIRAGLRLPQVHTCVHLGSWVEENRGSSRMSLPQTAVQVVQGTRTGRKSPTPVWALARCEQSPQKRWVVDGELKRSV